MIEPQAGVRRKPDGSPAKEKVNDTKHFKGGGKGMSAEEGFEMLSNKMDGMFLDFTSIGQSLRLISFVY